MFSYSSREAYGELLIENGARVYTSRYVSSYLRYLQIFSLIFFFLLKYFFYTDDFLFFFFGIGLFVNFFFFFFFLDKYANFLSSLSNFYPGLNKTQEFPFEKKFFYLNIIIFFSSRNKRFSQHLEKPS